MVEMLNGYFRAMNGALVAHHGHLSRLMGDGLMALFGALEHNPWQTADAVKAALAMRAALAAYNEQARRAAGWPSWSSAWGSTPATWSRASWEAIGSWSSR